MAKKKINIVFHSRKDLTLLTIDKNLGIGGTEYAVLLLANAIASMPEYEVFLISLSKLEIKSKTAFKIIGGSELDTNITTIICESYLRFLNFMCFKELIVWIHHPNLSLGTIKKNISCQDIKFVGLTASQFKRVELKNENLHLINPMYKPLQSNPREFPRSIQGKNINFGFIGSLTPEKGFHHVLAYWEDIHKIYPSACLHVFGSGSLYKQSKLGNHIPCDLIYEKKLLNINSCRDSNIIFHGLVENLDEYLDDIDIGLLNPFASAEAYPDSILKFYEYGIPVISGLFNGSKDLLYINEKIQFPNMMPLQAVRWLVKTQNYNSASASVINFMNNKTSNSIIAIEWDKVIRLNESLKVSHKIINRNYIKNIFNVFKFRLRYTLKTYLVRWR